MLEALPTPFPSIETSLGGLPPKGGVTRGKRRSASPPDRGAGGFQNMGSRRGKTSFFANKGLPVPAPFREASREPFWEPFWTPRRLPRGSQERPRSARRAPGTPQEARNEPQEVPNELQEAPNEPQEARKESQETQNEPQETPRSKFDVIFHVLDYFFRGFPRRGRRMKRSVFCKAPPR